MEFAEEEATAVGPRVADEEPGLVVRTLLRHRWATVAIGGIALVLVATALYVGTRAAPAPTASPPAVPVPGSLEPAIADAARSCPVLTFPRVAAQVMSASGFAEHATTPRGGSGIAGLTDAEWTRWMPDSTAARTDSAANIVALAHEMCDLVGAVRDAKVPGDPWQLALASYQTGDTAVQQAGGVPRDATTYVNQVGTYARWYEQREAKASPEASPEASPSSPAAVDDPSATPAATPTPAPPPPGGPTSGSTVPGPGPTKATVRPEPPAPAPSWTTVVVSATTVLNRGQSIRSNRTRLSFSTSGDLEIYDENGRRRWTSGTAAQGGYQAVFQADGNFAVYDQNWKSLWTSGTAAHDGAVLVLEADGNVCVVYRSAVIWASNTAH
jgi:hypothetical protein